MEMKTIAIIGATSIIAQHCARLWGEGGDVRLILVGRDEEKLTSVAQDLRVRTQAAEIITITGMFYGSAAIDALVDKIWQSAPVDLVLIAHGVLPQQRRAEQDLIYNAETLEINALSPVLFAEKFAHLMTERGRGHIAIIGSVAGDRGRKSNYVYGASKGLIERYMEGLQHRFAGTAIKISLIKPGPTRSPMTVGMEGGKLTLAEPEDVARIIVKGIKRDRLVIYAPAKWGVIMKIIRLLPGFIFNKMDI